MLKTVAYLLTLPSHASTVEQFLYALGDRKWLMGAAPPTLKDGDSLLEHFVCAFQLFHPFSERTLLILPLVLL